MYAIVVTGGKQYKVSKDDVFEVEKLNAGVGESVALDVVFIADGSTFTTENDKLSVAKVFAEVVEHFKGDKQLIFKFKKRKGYKRMRGHRQSLTRLLVKDISLTGEAPKASAKEAVEKKSTAAKTAAAKKTIATKVDAAETKAAPKAATSKKVVEVKDTGKTTAATEKKASATKAAATKTAASKTVSTRAKKTAADAEVAEKKPTRKTPAKETEATDETTEA